ncbi:MAG: TetR/AcrR family transcriptional regulator [Chloroflexi bacterium]|nr:TetR/AcrR family transcriptional regulator [Chloroflexota bacterium]
MPKQTFYNLPDDKRETLITIALDEFATHDYKNASISQIVAKAGIAKGSFYQYFQNKADLYRYLLDLGADAKMEMLSTTPPDPGIGIFVFLRWLMQERGQFDLHNPQLSQIGYRAAKNNDFPDDYLEDMMGQVRPFFTQLVTQGQQQGDIASDIDADLASFIFYVIFIELGIYLIDKLDVSVDGKLDDNHTPFSSPQADKLFDQVLRILESGMKPRSTP